MKKSEIISRLLNPGVIAIIRTDSADVVPDICRALVAGGVTAFEITMTTPRALDLIRELSAEMGDRATIGVGTIIDAATARQAITAGAKYVVTPVTKQELIEVCVSNSVPIASGAYTPTEALAAHEMGADFIKIFPADGLGAKYIKAIRAPLPQLKIVPTGGVDVKTCGDFIAAGCVAVAAGSTLVSKEIVSTKDWAKLTETAAAFVRAVADARKKL